jgi:hypothetical protein
VPHRRYSDQHNTDNNQTTHFAKPNWERRDTTQALERNCRWENRHDARRIREYNLTKINLVSPHFLRLHLSIPRQLPTPPSHDADPSKH